MHKQMRLTVIKNFTIILFRDLRRRYLVGYSPWGHKELDMNEHTTLSINDKKLPSGQEKPISSLQVNYVF